MFELFLKAVVIQHSCFAKFPEGIKESTHSRWAGDLWVAATARVLGLLMANTNAFLSCLRPAGRTSGDFSEVVTHVFGFRACQWLGKSPSGNEGVFCGSRGGRNSGPEDKLLVSDDAVASAHQASASAHAICAKRCVLGSCSRARARFQTTNNGETPVLSYLGIDSGNWDS